MLTFEEARNKVNDALAAHCPLVDDVAVLKEDLTRETAFGWAFFYNSAKFLRTKEFRYRLLGNGPVLVDRESGAIEFCGSAKPVAACIRDFAAKLRHADRG